MNSLSNWILWWAKPTLLLFLILGRADGASLVSPVAVPFASGKAFPQGWDNRNAPDPQYFAGRAVDGDPATYCCLLDDTLSGSSDATIPAKAAAPVTGHMVFDLGQKRFIVGATLFCRQGVNGALTPADVDFFYFADDDPANNPVVDDIENDQDIVLIDSHAYHGPGGEPNEAIEFDGIMARYVGMRVNSSYETGGSGKHYNYQIAEMQFSVIRDPAEVARQLALAKSYADAESWREAVVVNLGCDSANCIARAMRRFPQDRMILEIVADWIAQDGLIAEDGLRTKAIEQVLDEVEPRHDVPTTDPRWVELYLAACEKRRAARLEPVAGKLQRIVFTKHFDLGVPGHYSYAEGQSDAQGQRHFHPGSALCMLEMDDPYGKVHTLLEDPTGVIRDPDVSYDGQRILFSWKKSLDEDDYHLYEMKLADRSVRQLTSGLGFADSEGVYLPGGDIIFSSTRCVTTIDCFWPEASNLYTCDRDGKYLRRLGFDQVDTNYPKVTHDGRVIFTRWDYNDRGQIFPQPLFQMNQDGTGQIALYGENSWFPTSILHARAIPGTSKIVCIFSGHHTAQRGKLGILDPRKGRQENQGAQLIAPVRETPAVRIDQYGQDGDQFQYPYPLSEAELLVTFRPEGAKHFAVYYMTIDGRRELLASDPKISCNQQIPLGRKQQPPQQPSLVDYRRNSGVVYLHDIYTGGGLAGVERGTIKSLRVVALRFQAAGVGQNSNSGPAGQSAVTTPVSIGGGSWDVKVVLGTAKVYDDGSACFELPARTPIYVQALDEKGQMVQSMRSWLTLQPGETLSCVGCHEHKNAAPPVTPNSQAMAAGPQPLEPFYGPPRGFSFIEEVQPILDEHCIACHYLDPPEQTAETTGKLKPAFSLKGTQRLDRTAERKWSDAYLALADRRYVNWIDAQSAPPMLPPYHAGASQSPLIRLLEQGHYDVKLSKPQLDRLITWIDLGVPYCGDYTEAMSDEGLTKYNHFLQKRRRWQQQEARNVEQMLRDMK